MSELALEELRATNRQLMHALRTAAARLAERGAHGWAREAYRVLEAHGGPGRLLPTAARRAHEAHTTTRGRRRTAARTASRVAPGRLKAESGSSPEAPLTRGGRR